MDIGRDIWLQNQMTVHELQLALSTDVWNNMKRHMSRPLLSGDDDVFMAVIYRPLQRACSSRLEDSLRYTYHGE
jgi:hypothetical protein